MGQKTAIIIGAGPAGLTAAYELLKRTDIKPIIFESSGDIGGISKTVNYKGNRIDIGGHRFFSKSDRVMDWWRAIMPIVAAPDTPGESFQITYHNQSRDVAKSATAVVDAATTDLVMLVRRRMSRIFFLRKFFDYPVQMNVHTALNLGPIRIIKILLSYAKAMMFPIKEEKSLEDFFINRFGKELYLTFFKDYTEKVWGVPCHEIKPEWGAQRIKGLSITRAVIHAVTSLVRRDQSLEQKGTETSLIERFLYPKLGPGQLWEEVARQVKEMGGEIHHHKLCVGVESHGQGVRAATFKDTTTDETSRFEGDYFFSTMPIKDLIASMGAGVPAPVQRVASGLMYRDFVTVGLLVKKMKVKNTTNIKTANNLVPDNWIYIQERDVKIGRLQVFNNWSPYLVKDQSTVWLGLEYFCNVGDELWSLSDPDFIKLGIHELAKIDIINAADVLDSTILRVEKTYPAYFGSYDEFDVVRDFTDTFSNLFLVGRNGMHRYNNSDHSMLTAMTAVDNIIEGVKSKSNIWSVNTEQEYHEEKTEAESAAKGAQSLTAST